VEVKRSLLFAENQGNGAIECSGLMKQDTLMRNNNYQSLSCGNWAKT